MKGMHYAIVGGDRRNLHLKNLLQKKGYIVGIWGFDKINNDNINLYDALNSPTVICGIPFQKNEQLFAPFSSYSVNIHIILRKMKHNQLLIGGNLKGLNINSSFIDLLTDETFLRKNAALTAKGVIQIITEENNINVYNKNIVIIGNGRIGSTCCDIIANLGAKVYVIVKDISEITSNDTNNFIKYIMYNDINNYIDTAQIIINTPPGEVLTKSHLKFINKEALIIDVSSPPYGISENMENSIKILRPHGLPGIVDPLKAASYIMDLLIKHL